ncbi:MAG: hypothetical protein D6820_13465 [Lentisphaerae bacterium]|nr:MAG: hypothetical protein D6820_13465 [Lentisphaerota bacterium]
MMEQLHLPELPAQWQPERIREILQLAGKFALERQHRLDVTLKTDGTTLTQVDMALDRAFHQASRKTWLISEESCQDVDHDFLEQRGMAPGYILDPIDGTAPYSNCLWMWGISLGFACDGIICEGAIYLPATDEFIISHAKDVWYQRAGGKPVRMQKAKDLTAIQKKNIMIAIPQDCAKYGSVNLPNGVHAVGSAVVAIANLLLQRYGAFFGRLKLWDYAGGLPLCRKLGFHVDDEVGASWPDTLLHHKLIVAPSQPEHLRSKSLIYFCHPDFKEIKKQIKIKET